MSFNQPINYDYKSGRWNFEFHKAPKDIMAQCGIKISLDPGIPTGEKGAWYQTKEPSGLIGPTLEIRCFDNLSGWTSAVYFDLPTLLEKLIEIMPSDKVKTETFLLAERDLEYIKSKQQNEQHNG
jgi:hypothetical protein